MLDKDVDQPIDIVLRDAAILGVDVSDHDSDEGNQHRQERKHICRCHLAGQESAELRILPGDLLDHTRRFRVVEEQVAQCQLQTLKPLERRRRRQQHANCSVEKIERSIHDLGRSATHRTTFDVSGERDSSSIHDLVLPTLEDVPVRTKDQQLHTPTLRHAADTGLGDGCRRTRP